MKSVRERLNLFDVGKKALRAIRSVPAKFGANLIEAGLRMGGGNRHKFIVRMADQILVDDAGKRYEQSSSITEGPRC